VETHALLAMQKVVGSNPISRSDVAAPLDIAGRRKAGNVARLVRVLADRLPFASNSSSYSTPWMTPNTHQVRWSWMRVTWPGRQTSAMIENELSGSTVRDRLSVLRFSRPLAKEGRRATAGRPLGRHRIALPDRFARHTVHPGRADE
jgi:hypothetical protein